MLCTARIRGKKGFGHPDLSPLPALLTLFRSCGLLLGNKRLQKRGLAVEAVRFAVLLIPSADTAMVIPFLYHLAFSFLETTLLVHSKVVFRDDCPINSTNRVCAHASVPPVLSPG